MKLIKELSPLWDINLWILLDKNKIEKLSLLVQHYCDNQMQLIELEAYGLANEDKSIIVATFIDKRTNLYFNLIPGGVANLGLSHFERRRMEELLKGSEYFIAYDDLKLEYTAHIDPFFLSK